MHARTVSYDNGIDAEVFALVADDHGGDVLDLLVWDGGSFQERLGVPHREPTNIGPEGGGHTWHERTRT